MLQNTPRWWSYLEVEAGNERQFLHSELLGRLLVTATVTALDLRRAAKMLRPSEPIKHICTGIYVKCTFIKQRSQKHPWRTGPCNKTIFSERKKTVHD